MPAPSRTGFNSSPLVRLLAGLDIDDGSDAPGAKPTLAERLSPWLDWTDAIALFGVLDGGAATPTAAARPAPASQAPAVIEDFQRVHTDLAQAITDDPQFAADPAADEADFAPYRRRYLAQQQAMAARIGPLRARVRAALTAHSAELGQLAALDAVLDQALGERERHLLAKVPALLEQHLARLRRAQSAAAAGSGQSADPRLQPAAIRQTLRALLRAELEIRLQPVEGLLDTLGPRAAARP